MQVFNSFEILFLFTSLYQGVLLDPSDVHILLGFNADPWSEVLVLVRRPGHYLHPGENKPTKAGEAGTVWQDVRGKGRSYAIRGKSLLMYYQYLKAPGSFTFGKMYVEKTDLMPSGVRVCSCIINF